METNLKKIKMTTAATKDEIKEQAIAAGAAEKRRIVLQSAKKSFCNKRTLDKFTFETSDFEQLKIYFNHGLQLEVIHPDLSRAIELGVFTYYELCQILNKAETTHRAKYEHFKTLQEYLLTAIPILMRKKLREKEEDHQNGSGNRKKRRSSLRSPLRSSPNKRKPRKTTSKKSKKRSKKKSTARLQ
jgi:hypothetical protein